jgi:hypothetical protein
MKKLQASDPVDLKTKIEISDHVQRRPYRKGENTIRQTVPGG